MFSKNKGLAKTNSKELLLNKSGVNSGGKGTEREESMAGKERLMAIRQTIQMQKKASVGELTPCRGCHRPLLSMCGMCRCRKSSGDISCFA